VHFDPEPGVLRRLQDVRVIHSSRSIKKADPPARLTTAADRRHAYVTKPLAC
jgi:hypothetical protein